MSVSFRTLVLITLALCFTGCGAEDVEVIYGRRRGVPGKKSLNGTSVLSERFEQEGYYVTSWRRLSPRLDQADIIVWVPDAFEAPSGEQREYLEDWLASRGGRSLVYVGRDFDAEMTYWEKVSKNAPGADVVDINRRLQEAQDRYERERKSLPDNEYCRWFTIRDDQPARNINTLQGPWSSGVDGSQCEIELRGRLDIPQPEDVPNDATDAVDETEELLQFRKLLFSGDDVLVARARDDYWGDSELIVVANSSFLTNLPLVNHEHRKLVNHLLDEVEDADVDAEDRKVVFLETGSGGPPISDDDAPPPMPTGFEAFSVWPLGTILLHVFVLGIIFCFAMFPIFGRPRQLEEDSTADFGKHVAALGKLLQRTGNREYADARIQQYDTQMKRESGSSHSAGARSHE